MIEVDSSSLGVAGVARAGVGADLESVCRSLRHAVDLLEASCADPQLTCAAAEFARGWVAALSASAADESGGGRLLAGSAESYAQVESAAATGLAS